MFLLYFICKKLVIL